MLPVNIKQQTSIINRLPKFVVRILKLLLVLLFALRVVTGFKRARINSRTVKIEATMAPACITKDVEVSNTLRVTELIWIPKILGR